MNHLNKYLEKGFREIYSKNPKITKQEMAKELDLSVRTIYRYCNLTGIHLIYTGTYTGGDTIRVTYYPEYTPLADRDSDLPFASSINNVVIAWTVRQILEGQNAMTADMANAKTEADKFASGVTSEATFVTQCRLYSNDEEDKYADADASLVSEVKKSDIESACADWIVSSDRSFSLSSQTIFSNSG